MKPYQLEKDVHKALQKYPQFTCTTTGDRGVVLRGKFTARNASIGIDIESYVLEITIGKEYPFAFPKVVEVEEKIPRQTARHVRYDNTVCFCNPQEEYKLCRRGITLVWFFRQVLNPHLCREYYREKTGGYPTGERSHGSEGIWEGYYDLLGTKNKLAVIEQLKLLLFQPPALNAICFCGSAKKYKRCHITIADEVVSIGRIHAVRLFYHLENDLNKKYEVYK